jgi:hypothetical protein
VLYIGTETGIFLTLDRGKSWRRLQANLPTVRVDEIAIHPRDNAMIVATHGRSLFILDHLEPIQEYATIARAETGKLFTVPTALQWKSKDDRNDEFWGHQFFTGENPPTDAVISFYLKSAANDLKLRISDFAGRQVRELTPPANRRQPGIQTACWDMRVAPIEVPADSAAGRVPVVVAQEVEWSRTRCRGRWWTRQSARSGRRSSARRLPGRQPLCYRGQCRRRAGWRRLWWRWWTRRPGTARRAWQLQRCPRR